MLLLIKMSVRFVIRDIILMLTYGVNKSMSKPVMIKHHLLFTIVRFKSNQIFYTTFSLKEMDAFPVIKIIPLFTKPVINIYVLEVSIFRPTYIH